VRACHRLGRIDEHPVKSGQMNILKELMLPLARRPLNSPRPIRERVFRGRLRLRDTRAGGRCSEVYWARPEDPIRRQQPPGGRPASLDSAGDALPVRDVAAAACGAGGPPAAEGQARRRACSSVPSSPAASCGRVRRGREPRRGSPGVLAMCHSVRVFILGMAAVWRAPR